MSARPTPSLCRAGIAVAVVSALLVPATAPAKPKDKPAKGGSPAVCHHDLPPGIAKKGGDLPPGIAKKVEGTGPPCDEPGGPRQGSQDSKPQAAAPAAPAAPAAAPAATTVASSQGAQPRCVGKRMFRVRLDKKGRVRKARVTLNGRAIAVTRGKRGRASVLVDLRKRVAGVYVVRTTVLTRKGKLVTGTRRYRVCA